MKRYLFLLILFVLASCSKEEGLFSKKDADSSMQTISITTKYDSNTKAIYSDGNGLKWTSDDATELGLLCGSSWTQAKSSAISMTSNDATFTASVPEGTTSFSAYYPASLAKASGSSVSFTIPSEQKQSAAGASNDKQILLVSNSVTEASGSYVATMKPAAALVRFIIYSSVSTYRSQSVTSVTVNGSSDISGTLSYDFSSGSSTFNGSFPAATTTLGSSYSLSNATSKTADGTKGIYVQVAPGSVMRSFTVATAAQTSNDTTYTEFKFSSPKTINGNSITNVFVDCRKGLCLPLRVINRSALMLKI